MAWPGWAGLGLSWGFYVRLIFKDRVGLEENILHPVCSSGEQQCQACWVPLTTEQLSSDLSWELAYRAECCPLTSGQRPSMDRGPFPVLALLAPWNASPQGPSSERTWHSLPRECGSGPVTHASQGNAGRASRASTLVAISLSLSHPSQAAQEHSCRLDPGHNSPAQSSTGRNNALM